MITVERNADITAYTTFGLPARCAAFVQWDTTDDLRRVMADASLPRLFKAIGGGSNLLFTAPFMGTVLRQRDVTDIPAPGADGLWTVPGAVVLDHLCARACALGIHGFENLSGIPGRVSGAVVQNAGAYGVETGDLVHTVHLLDGDLSRQAMRFGYRRSALKGSGRIITAVTFRLPQSTELKLDYGNLRSLVPADGTIADVRRAVLQMRASKLPEPAEVGSAGSFFRNPELEAEQFDRFIAANPDAPHFRLADGRVKVPAAWLIDRAGLKGARKGGAEVWPQQPLVIANVADATAQDVLDLEREIITTVMRRFGIALTPEVEHL